ncbi:succinyl-CoA synthetase alpha subunit [Mycolicibacterium sp. BK556]|uniref:acyl-CoA synthetase FdrA n=1 Tax=unclassified Mycolicibacterium TaxID=2636767 RepID=UPI00161A68E3|nr:MULTISPECIES: acyl-CoA synthetase FdrA [unclassified Mycolicibacterium]MBB3603041.1 succinyl-CoA synthetase alpha subunit [Mycolicibacterium sp. BK556]MBB3633236.1 succinyl-CoA synthetase alpha subunit [Mycolicibacterium sp. BK607]
MGSSSRFYPNLYKDSVSLMTVSARVTSIPGIEAASVVMASATNIDNLALAGLGTFEVRPNDLIVAVAGTEEACDEALAVADKLLSAAPGDGGESSVAAPTTSIQMAVAKDPALNLALISVPGDYAAAEAMKALRLGLDVMVFSDNVSVADELALKQYARDADLMVMGPDCGTSIVNGIPLGFANVVRRGPIGVVGASGTGTQEVTVRIHQNGSGVSQALGTGGHDLADVIGGISMLHGLAALDGDPDTEVIVLVSKPPSGTVAAKVLAAARSSAKPVVVIFLGADPATITGDGVYGAAYLAQAADMAVQLARGERPDSGDIVITPEMRSTLDDLAASMSADQRYVRGIFSGGTFCFEAQLVHRAHGITAHSNTPVAGNTALTDIRTSLGNTIIDMGDDEFTQGKPHPMIDPSGKDARIRDEIADPTTAVVLFDVVLGYGSAEDPTAELISIIDAARADGSTAAFVGYVCGTDLDPQDRAAAVAGLKSAGALVASSNAEAALWSATLIAARGGQR